MRSFRGELARRTALAAGGLVLTMAVISFLVLATLLRGDLDGSLRRIAEYEASVAASTDENEFHFHEAVLLGLQDARLPELARFAQLLDLAGNPLVRSRSSAAPVDPPARGVRSVAASGTPVFTSHRSGTLHIRSLVYPIRLSGSDQLYLLHVAAPTQPLRDTLFSFAFLLGGLVLAGAALGYWLGWRGGALALRPVNEIASQAAALGPGSLADRITAHDDVHEFRQLVGVLNAMLDRVERTLESQQRFTADASHELRGPLNVLRGEIDVALKRERTPAEYREVLQRCHREVLRLTRLAQDLLLLARAEAGALGIRREPVALDRLIEDVADRHRREAADRGVALEASGHPVAVTGDRDLLERAVANLVHNAISHAGRGTAVLVTIPHPDRAEVVVRDTGPGIPDHAVPMLFDRFYQADPSRPRESGVGLGLSIARAAVEAHGGTLGYEGNDPGAVFRIVLPGGRPLTRAAVQDGEAA